MKKADSFLEEEEMSKTSMIVLLLGIMTFYLTSEYMLESNRIAILLVFGLVACSLALFSLKYKVSKLVLVVVCCLVGISAFSYFRIRTLERSFIAERERFLESSQ